MPTFKLDKLVRSELPRLYKEDCQEPGVEELRGDKLIRALLEKVEEEVNELESGERTAEGFADACQIVRETLGVDSSPDVAGILNLTQQRIGRLLAETPEVTMAAVEKAIQMKTEAKGGFVIKQGGEWVGIKVESLTLQSDDPWVAYYRQYPERFPEIKEGDHARA